MEHRPDETETLDDAAADVEFVIEELWMAFMEAERNNEKEMRLISAVGSRFHGRVKKAAEYLGV